MKNQTHATFISRIILIFSSILLGLLASAAVSANDGVNTNRNPVADFDGDGKSDISVFRPSNGFWYVMKSSGGFSSTQWGRGNPVDTLVPGDYDGDGKTDHAIVRHGSTNYVWYILRSSDQTIQSISFGVDYGISLFDIPIPADYDGDGKTDLATHSFTESSEPKDFKILQSSNDTRVVKQWGLSNEDQAVPPADYDGDGKADLTVVRGSFNGSVSEAVWYILQSSDGIMRVERFGFGLSYERFVPADYDGDGKADIAVWRYSDGFWYIKNSSGVPNFTSVQFGAAGDRHVPGDYDGDGKTDLAVFRTSTGVWYLLQSTEGFTAQQFGYGDDVPIPNVFVR